MKNSTWPIRTTGLIAALALLGLLLANPVGARFSSNFQVTEEPTVRPTATPSPYLELSPQQGVAGDATPVTASGGSWPAGHTIRLYWDDTNREVGSGQIQGDGTFVITFNTPTDPPYGSVGPHRVLAVATSSDQAEASFELIQATPTTTPTFTPTPTNTSPPTPTNTRTPVTPSATPTPTVTPTPSPTLRPLTPMMTITPIPPTRAPATGIPAATRTPTRPPGTPTSTFTPSPTPGPGTPSVTPFPTALPSPTVGGEIAETGGGWGPLLIWGSLLAGLVVAFRFLRVRALGDLG